MLFKASFIFLPSEQVHVCQYLNTDIRNLLNMCLFNIFGVLPSTSLIDNLGSHHSSSSYKMIIIDIAFHVHTTGINVKMQNTRDTITMKSCHILAVSQMGSFGTGTLCAIRQINRIKCLDELFCQLFPISHSPSCGLFIGWGYFHSYHRILQRSSLRVVTSHLCQMEIHTLPHGFG